MFESRPRRSSQSPTLVLIVTLLVTFAVQFVTALFGLESWLFVLAWPIVTRPWALVTSVFAHSGIVHLLANVVALAIGGFLLERYTTPTRFYLYFVATGALSGAAQVIVLTPLTVGRAAVIGASGGILAIYGYLAASNRVSDLAAAGISLSPRLRIVLFTTLALIVALVTMGPEVAIIGHFTGFLLGLISGRSHLLRVR